MTSTSSKPSLVTVHPIVLLSVVDHYNRVARDTRRRVVGILLGETSPDGRVEALNSYAVPFDEDDKDPSVWFVDHNFHEAMFAMFRKVSAKEKIIGWYSTGPKIRPNDLAIHEILRKYTPEPVYVIIEVKPEQNRIPTDAYYAKEEIKDESSEPTMMFQHIPSQIDALEAEEIGVEHLLRDVKDMTVSSLSMQVTEKLSSLSNLEHKLLDIQNYLDRVIAGKMPVSHTIMYLLQDILNLLPNLSVADMTQALTSNTNDRMAVIYVSALIRSIIAVHNLINNKITLKEAETKAMAPSKESTVPDNFSGSFKEPVAEKAGGFSK